ncbi:unnamed protein product [Prorocentrum cordatum]|uniref:Alpha-aminoacylpeptide hydrolase n=1 Tax=Prorocentrum cordatum TaxID=2364126 RepID=A0ABN9UDZ1_9DINO|nr:unnamed protein product [Polarella glacialis]
MRWYAWNVAGGLSGAPSAFAAQPAHLARREATAFKMEMDTFDQQIDRILAKSEAMQRSHERQVTSRWQAWAVASFAGGASRAHRFSKPQALQEVIHFGAGVQHAYQLADRKLSYWSEFWRTHKDGPIQLPSDAANWDQLPPLSGADVRRAIRAFSLRSGAGQIKIAPRALDFLSDTVRPLGLVLQLNKSGHLAVTRPTKYYFKAYARVLRIEGKRHWVTTCRPMARCEEFGRAGAMPSVGHGAAVNGINDWELKQLRNMAGSFCGFSGSGSLTLYLAVQKQRNFDPIFHATCSILMQHASWVWTATGSTAQLQKARMALKEKFDGASSPVTWASARGPPSALWVALRMCPSEVKHYMYLSLERWQSHRILDRLPGAPRRDAGGRRQHIWIRALRHWHLQKMSNGLRGALAKLQSHGMWTPARRQGAGYRDDAACEFCGHAPADPEHELFYCSVHEAQEDEEHSPCPDDVLQVRKGIWQQGQTGVGLEWDFSSVDLLYALPMRSVEEGIASCLSSGGPLDNFSSNMWADLFAKMAALDLAGSSSVLRGFKFELEQAKQRMRCLAFAAERVASMLSRGAVYQPTGKRWEGAAAMGPRGPRGLQRPAGAEAPRRARRRRWAAAAAAALLAAWAGARGRGRGPGCFALQATSARARERELLPAHAIPRRYELALELDPEGAAAAFSGRLAVELAVVDPGSKLLTLHARSLSIALGSVRMWLNETAQTVTFAFPAALPLGHGVLSLSYGGVLGEDMAGLYRSWYTGVTGSRQAMALTQLEAVEARRVLPCWDEPSRKAVFALTLSFPAHLTALSNMPVASEETLADGRKVVSFLDSPVMSSYLLAMAVGRFDAVQRATKGGVLVRVLTTPGQQATGMFALEVAVRALDFYGEYFGVPYPLPKLDMLAAPDFAAGAMENWGLVIYREVDLLCDVSSVGVSRKMRIATVVTHELAHMWFGNLVTMEWWDQLWLNEGFANWMQTHAADVLFPEWSIWDQYIVQEQSQALGLDALRNSHPIEVPIYRAQEVDEVFDLISYAKGGSVVRMVHGFLGHDLFRAGLVLYMRRHAYGNTDSADLWSCWEEVSDQPVRAMMQSWTLQQGFPLLTVGESGSLRGQLSVRQRWFLADGSELPGDDEKVWQVPLLPGGASGLWAPSGQLLGRGEGSLALPRGSSGWLKLNFGQVAPYRVLYATPALRDSLVSALQRGEVGVADRIGLLLDSAALARAGKLPAVEVLRLLAGLRGEASAHVWEAIARVLNSLHRALSYVGLSGGGGGPELVELFEAAVAGALIRPALESFGWSPGDGEGDLLRQRRALVVALAARFMGSDAGVVGEARARFDAWLASPLAGGDGHLPDDLKGSVFRIVLAGAQGEREYRALRREAARAKTRQAVRLSVYQALGAHEGLQDETLAMALNGAVRLQDVMYPLVGVVQSGPGGARRAWSWFVEQHAALVRRTRGANVRIFGAVVDLAAGSVPEAARAGEVEAFFERHPAPGLERSVAQLVESVRNEAQFVAALGAEAEGGELVAALRAMSG